MRRSLIECDECGALITECVVGYANHWLIPIATYEGARSSWDFCSDECLDAWRAERDERYPHRSFAKKPGTQE